MSAAISASTAPPLDINHIAFHDKLVEYAPVLTKVAQQKSEFRFDIPTHIQADNLRAQVKALGDDYLRRSGFQSSILSGLNLHSQEMVQLLSEITGPLNNETIGREVCTRFKDGLKSLRERQDQLARATSDDVTAKQRIAELRDLVKTTFTLISQAGVLEMLDTDWEDVPDAMDEASQSEDTAAAGHVEEFDWRAARNEVQDVSLVLRKKLLGECTRTIRR
jgi:hypothetical protein